MKIRDILASQRDPQKRFTLMELLVVISIFIILSAVGLPVIMPILRGSSVRLARMTLRTGIAAARGYAVKNNTICALVLYNDYDPPTSQAISDLRGFVACYEVYGVGAYQKNIIPVGYDAANSFHDKYIVTQMKLPLNTTFGLLDTTTDTTLEPVPGVRMALTFYSNGSLNPPGGYETEIRTTAVRTLNENSEDYDYRAIKIYSLTGKVELVE